jgi:hypothetical protein
MVRKAKGTFWVSLVALAFIVVFAHLTLDGVGARHRMDVPLLIACLGTIYLCSGLRFDFREELERMDVIRAWPLHPARVFFAMLLPEVALVTLLLAATVLLEAGVAGRLSPHHFAIVGALPFLVFTWVALDNLVFLFAPVRIVPGQDGLVQNAGRRMIQMALLFVPAFATAGCAALAFWGATSLAAALGAPDLLALVAGFVAVFGVLLCASALLVLLGGAVLRRFDVARDRA